MSDLHNESIFITGGGSGLGLALVERFIEEGAQVATLELSAAKVARFHGVAVAKDARTIVCKEQGEFYLNTTGNSGMATAGSGDVLTGVILGLLAQGMNAIDAAVNGVYLHGRAGELAAKLHTEYGVMAGDIADCLMKDYDEKESVKK